MKTTTLLAPTLSLALLGLAACSQGPDAPSAPEATETSTPADTTVDTGDSAAPPADQPATAETIPASFRGVWDRVSGTCGGVSETRLEVGADSMKFYESSGDVTRVEIDSPDRITVALSMQGEGETWTMARQLVLSEGGRRLTQSAVTPEEQFEPIPLERCAS